MPIMRIFRKIYFDFMTDFFNGLPYVKLGKILLTLFGLWPYGKRIVKRWFYLLFVTWAAISITVMIEGLMEATIWDTVMFYQSLALILGVSSSLIVATTLYIGEQSLKKLYDQMEFNWRAINDAEEITIMKTFAWQATTMTGKHAGCSLIGGIILLVANYLSPAYDNANEYLKIFSTYSKHWIIVDKLYKHQIIVHSILIACYASLLYIAVLHVYLYSVKHTCGLFAIVSYKLRKLTKLNDLELTNNMNRDDKIICELVDIIVKHKEAIRSCNIAGRAFNFFLYSMQITGLLCTAVFIYGTQLSFNLKSIHMIFRMIPWVAINLQYGFFLNYGGQQIIEFSNKVFTDSWYYTCWESMPIKTKKILLMLMLRSSQSYVLKAGLMTISLENYARLTKISWSLSTVLFSVQNNNHGIRKS